MIGRVTFMPLMENYLGILFWVFIIWCFVPFRKSEWKGEDVGKLKLRNVIGILVLCALGLILGSAWGGYRLFG